MTHGDVNTFAASLVEMALATKRVPELETINAEITRERDEALDRIAQMEVRAAQRRIETEQLHARIRELEVQRDDAELRFLECDDAKQTLERTLDTILGEAKGVLAAVRPPVAQPEPTPTAVTEPAPLPSAPSTPEASPAESPTVHSADAPASAGPASSSEGERAADPTASTTSALSAPSVNPTDTAISSTSTSALEEAPSGPFASSGSIEPNPSQPVHGGDAEKPVAAQQPEDPEPSEKWSHEWWQWNDRRVDRLHRAAPAF